MTTETQDWTTMPAGRELDALVWEHVFGREPWIVRDGSYVPQTFTTDAGGFNFTVGPTHYSTDITAAWLIVERMRATRDAMPMIEHCRDDEFDYGADERPAPIIARAGEWMVHFQDVCLLGTGAGATAPLAICRAALAACAPSGGADHA